MLEGVRNGLPEVVSSTIHTTKQKNTSNYHRPWSKHMVLGFGWLKILLSVVCIFFFFHENINFVVQISRNFNGFKKFVTDFIVSPYFFIFFFNNVKNHKFNYCYTNVS